MRTRSQSLQPPEPVTPTKSILCKRRYRSVEEDDPGVEEHASSIEDRNSLSPGCSPNPKPMKRVRFSDQGPGQPETGLTPYFRKSSLGRPSKNASQEPSRSQLNTRFPTPNSTDANPFAIIEQQQFAPIREALDNRLKRRLRRSHLSEEQNLVEGDFRSNLRAQNEVARLREEDMLKEERIRDLVWELESQRQFGIRISEDDELRHAELREEVESFRNRALQASEHTACNSNLSSSSPLRCTDGGLSSPLPFEDETFFSSPSSYAARKSSTNRPRPINNPFAKRRDAHTQVTPADIPATGPNDTEAPPSRELEDAQEALNIAHRELASLGFMTEDSNLEHTLALLRESFRRARLELEYTLPGETTGNLEDGRALLSALVTHVKRLIAQIERHAQTISGQQQSETALRGQFNLTLERVSELDIHVARLETHRHDLQNQLAEKERHLIELQEALAGKDERMSKDKAELTDLSSQTQTDTITINRLQAALTSYREEVASLENLINNMTKSVSYRRGRDRQSDEPQWMTDGSRRVQKKQTKSGNKKLVRNSDNSEPRDKQAGSSSAVNGGTLANDRMADVVTETHHHSDHLKDTTMSRTQEKFQVLGQSLKSAHDRISGLEATLLDKKAERQSDLQKVPSETSQNGNKQPGTRVSEAIDRAKFSLSENVPSLKNEELDKLGIAVHDAKEELRNSSAQFDALRNEYDAQQALASVMQRQRDDAQQKCRALEGDLQVKEAELERARCSLARHSSEMQLASEETAAALKDVEQFKDLLRNAYRHCNSYLDSVIAAQSLVTDSNSQIQIFLNKLLATVQPADRCQTLTSSSHSSTRQRDSETTMES